MQMTSPIQMESLQLQYGKTVAVHGLSLAIPENSLVTLLGPSGCGKTTTLRAIAGLERLSAGRLVVSGRIVDEPARRTFVAPDRRDVGMVFQHYGLWPHLTVKQNVAYPMKVQRVPRPERERRVAELLEMMRLDEYTHRYPGALSGGQQQRVAVARALAKRPSVLLFDEPLSNLDARLRRTLRSQLREVHEQSGTTSVFVTHDHEEALAISDYVAVLLNGELKQFGKASEVYNHPNSKEVAEFLGFDNVLSVSVSSADGSRVVVDGTRAELLIGKQDAAPGQRGTLAIRRDQLCVVDESDAHPSKIAVHVTKAAYVGGRTEFSAHFNGVSLESWVDDWTLQRLAMQVPRAGDTLYLRFPEDSLRLLPASGSMAAPEVDGVALPLPAASTSLEG